MRNMNETGEKMKRYIGKVVVITGGASGIGCEVALAYYREGAHLVIIDKDIDNLERVNQDFEKKRVMSRFADITVENEVKRAIDDALERFGHIDILVNCAGVAGEGIGFDQSEGRDWDECFLVNVKATFFLSRYIIPVMKKQKSGRIINFSSSFVNSSGEMLPHYSASKTAINNFTVNMAREIAADGITVNAICPGLVWTSMWERLEKVTLKKLPAKYKKKKDFFNELVKTYVPIGKEQTTTEVAELVLFLTQDSVKSITGQTIYIDGGMSIK